MRVPFDVQDWPQALQDAAGTLWAWHEGAEVRDDALRERAYGICDVHELPRELIDLQSDRCPDVFAKAADLTRYIDRTAGSHALLLAKLGGERSKWIEAPIRAFARALFLTRTLCLLSDDLERGRVFLPKAMVDAAGVVPQDLLSGPPDARIRRLLWKQTVRARDAYAQCRTLNTDLSGWMRRRYRIYWRGGLELLGIMEARRFDVWSKPVEISPIRAIGVYWQAYLGKIR